MPASAHAGASSSLIGSGGAGDVALAGAELREAVARSRAFDGDREVAAGHLAGEFADADGDRLHRRRAGDEHGSTGELGVATGSAAARCRRSWPRWSRLGLGRSSGASVLDDPVSSSLPQAAAMRVNANAPAKNAALGSVHASNSVRGLCGVLIGHVLFMDGQRHATSRGSGGQATTAR